MANKIRHLSHFNKFLTHFLADLMLHINMVSAQIISTQLWELVTVASQVINIAALTNTSSSCTVHFVNVRNVLRFMWSNKSHQITANKYDPNHVQNEDIYLSTNNVELIENVVTAFDNCNPASLSKLSKRVERNSGSDKLV